jgi:hypothetical protein
MDESCGYVEHVDDGTTVSVMNELLHNSGSGGIMRSSSIHRKRPTTTIQQLNDLMPPIPTPGKPSSSSSSKHMRVFQRARGINGSGSTLLASDMRQQQQHQNEAGIAAQAGVGSNLGTKGYINNNNNNGNNTMADDDTNNNKQKSLLDDIVDDGSTTYYETQLTPVLSNKSSFDSGQYDWNMACGGRLEEAEEDGNIRH